MLVYHGAMLEISEPKISYSRRRLDFGKGFYLAKDYEQADKWAGRFLKSGEQGIVNDRVFNTEELYMAGLISEKDALGRLQYQKTNWQICIRNQEILDECLVFQKSEVCHGGK